MNLFTNTNILFSEQLERKTTEKEETNTKIQQLEQQIVTVSTKVQKQPLNLLKVVALLDPGSLKPLFVIPTVA